jgi:hypothetical protein
MDLQTTVKQERDFGLEHRFEALYSGSTINGLSAISEVAYKPLFLRGAKQREIYI